MKVFQYPDADARLHIDTKQRKTTPINRVLKDSTSCRTQMWYRAANSFKPPCFADDVY